MPHEIEYAWWVLYTLCIAALGITFIYQIRQERAVLLILGVGEDTPPKYRGPIKYVRYLGCLIAWMIFLKYPLFVVTEFRLNTARYFSTWFQPLMIGGFAVISKVYVTTRFTQISEETPEWLIKMLDFMAVWWTLLHSIMNIFVPIFFLRGVVKIENLIKLIGAELVGGITIVVLLMIISIVKGHLNDKEAAKSLPARAKEQLEASMKKARNSVVIVSLICIAIVGILGNEQFDGGWQHFMDSEGSATFTPAKTHKTFCGVCLIWTFVPDLIYFGITYYFAYFSWITKRDVNAVAERFSTASGPSSASDDMSKLANSPRSSGNVYLQSKSVESTSNRYMVSSESMSSTQDIESVGEREPENKQNGETKSLEFVEV